MEIPKDSFDILLVPASSSICWFYKNKEVGEFVSHVLRKLSSVFKKLTYSTRTKTYNNFFKNEISLPRDTNTSGEQDDLHERGRVHGTSINSDRGEESGAGCLSAHNRDLLHIPQGKPSAFDCRSRAARDFLGNNFQ